MSRDLASIISRILLWLLFHSVDLLLWKEAMETEKNKKIAGVHEELQNTQTFLLKLCSQEYKVVEAKRRASKGEYETTANLLHSTYEQF